VNKSAVYLGKMALKNRVRRGFPDGFEVAVLPAKSFVSADHEDRS
jgi:hypothetical protein